MLPPDFKATSSCAAGVRAGATRGIRARCFVRLAFGARTGTLGA
jgi:hypothetical protein